METENLTEYIKARAFDFVASKNNGTGLSVEAEETLIEFVKFLINGE